MERNFRAGRRVIVTDDVLDTFAGIPMERSERIRVVRRECSMFQRGTRILDQCSSLRVEVTLLPVNRTT